MSNTFHTIYLILSVLLFVACGQLANCYWPQRKFDQYRTNHIGFFPKHAEWTASIPKLNTLQDLSCLVLNAKQSAAYTIISNSTSSTQFLQVDLLKGGSKVVDLSGHINRISPIGAVMDEAGNYYVLAKNYITSNTILVQINVFTGKVATRVLDNYGKPYSIVYSRNSQLIVIVSDYFIGSFDISSLNEVWKQQNIFPSTPDTSSMLVKEKNNEDVIYVLTKVIQKFKVKDGFRFQRIISIPEGQPKYMTSLGVEGLMAVVSVDYRTGVNYISAFNYENGVYSSTSLQNFCGYPLFSFENGGRTFNTFHFAVPCFDFGKEVNYFMEVFTPVGDGNVTVHEVYIRNTQTEPTVSISYDSELDVYLAKTSNTNMYEISDAYGSVLSTITSSISGDICETFTSSNSMLYSFCLTGGSLNIESKAVNY